MPRKLTGEYPERLLGEWGISKDSVAGWRVFGERMEQRWWENLAAAVFSTLFKADLDAETERYGFVSERLASAFKERVGGQAREIIKWQGGDHVGPHGLPCRRTTPFPFYTLR